MMRTTLKHTTLIALSCVLATGFAGCKSAPATIDDPTLTATVQKRIAADSALSTEPIQVKAQTGVVTLAGSVSNGAARTLAARDAAGVAGVTEVVNSLIVGPATSTSPTRSSQQKLESRTQNEPRQPMESAIPNEAPVTRTPLPPVLPPPPVARTVTLPAGSTLPVRVTQSLDSATTQAGDSFSGAIATDIIVDGMVMIPRGAPVTGRVTEVHEAGHFKGSSLLTVELTGLNSRGEHISLSTQSYSVQGKGRGENTAVKTGVGAAAGAILGGIFGGGKGAAIGAAAGGGTGAGINAVTRGQQVQIPSETIVRFVLANSIATRTSTHAGGNPGEPSLQNR